MESSQHAVVTGAGRGFGAALVDVLTASGWRVTSVCRTARTPRPRERVIEGDVRDDATVARLAEALDGDTVDVLINNAGMSGGGRVLAEVTRPHLEESFAVNVTAPLEITRAALPGLVDAAGLVVNVSSRLASMSRQASDHYDIARLRTSYAYRITKAAQNMLSIALTHELSARGVAVWAVHPGRLTTRLGSAEADTDAHDAAQSLLTLIANRRRDEAVPRFISLDLRERDAPDADLPW